MAKGKYLVFLNNDTVSLPDWLDNLVSIIENQSDVGIVGSKLLFPNGTIQHAGVAIAENAPWPLTPFHIFHRKPGDFKEANRFRELQVVTGACMLIRRELFFDVGCFDEAYVNGYEDVDLCLKVRQKGYRVIYCPHSVLYHYESVSEGRFNHIDPNICHFHAKWLGKIEPDMKTRVNPLTSIVIPCYNQVEYTKLCLASVFEHTKEPFELILVNNGSEDGTNEYFNYLAGVHKNIQIINNSNNLGFGAACNQGMAIAKGEFVLILNNDVVVTSGWLTRMIKLANSSKEIGIVGPRSNCVAGAQVIKEVPYQDLEGMHLFAAELAARYATSSFEINRVIGLCMLIKKKW
ncbi:hypothetical protein N752_18680 [Desulforamulus aquiferis]|nr:hypothetical protein N752_18680 [Desulforamulus aquiferis]